jgi:hypothetical protein
MTNRVVALWKEQLNMTLILLMTAMTVLTKTPKELQ